MDLSFILQILFLIALLPFIIFLIHITLKYSGKYMNGLSRNKLIRVVERTPIGQNSFLSVVIIDDKPYVISNGEKGAQILMELDSSVLEKHKGDFSGEFKSIPGIDKLLIKKFRGKVKHEKIQ